MAIPRYVQIVGSSFQVDNDILSMFSKGIKASRTTKIPITGTEVLFEVQVGRVLLLNIIGEITVLLGAVATNAKLQANPTATGASVDLCAAVAIENAPLATLLSITGTVGDAMQKGLAVVGSTKPFVIQKGSIDVNCTAAVGSGEWKWDAYYVALDDGAVLVPSYA